MIVSLDTKDGDAKKTGKICWGGSVEGIDCGDDVAEWLSWNLDRPGLRLIRCTGRNPPVVNNYGKLKHDVGRFSQNVLYTIMLSEDTKIF